VAKLEVTHKKDIEVLEGSISGLLDEIKVLKSNKVTKTLEQQVAELTSSIEKLQHDVETRDKQIGVMLSDLPWWKRKRYLT
jgi:hypothetical protein